MIQNLVKINKFKKSILESNKLIFKNSLLKGRRTAIVVWQHQKDSYGIQEQLLIQLLAYLPNQVAAPILKMNCSDIWYFFKYSQNKPIINIAPLSKSYYGDHKTKIYFIWSIHLNYSMIYTLTKPVNLCFLNEEYD